MKNNSLKDSMTEEKSLKIINSVSNVHFKNSITNFVLTVKNLMSFIMTFKHVNNAIKSTTNNVLISMHQNHFLNFSSNILKSQTNLNFSQPH